MGAQALFGDDVYGVAQEIFKVLLERDEIEKIPVGCHFHKEVEVTRGAGLPTCARPENPGTQNAVLRGNPEDLFLNLGSCRANRFLPRLHVVTL
jgi:hypothetical protein